MGSLHKNIQLMLQFLLYINDLSDVNCNIAVYADDTTHYSKCDQASDMWQQIELASELESNLGDTVDWCRICLVACLWTGVIKPVLLMQKWMGLFTRKDHL